MTDQTNDHVPPRPDRVPTASGRGRPRPPGDRVPPRPPAPLRGGRDAVAGTRSWGSGQDQEKIKSRDAVAGEFAPGGLVPGESLEPGPALPHESVFARLRESALSAAATSEVVSGREVIELPVPAKRGDAFMGSGRYLRVANENGWEHRATYTRIRAVSAKGAVRYTATCAIAFRRGAERMVGYWRTNAKGAYVFAWAARRATAGDTFGAAPLSAAGLAAVLALPGTPCAGCPRVLAAHRPVTSGEPEDEETAA